MAILSRSALLSLPLIALYWLGWEFYWPVPLMTSVFQGLNAVLVLAALVAVYKHRSALRGSDVLFWGALFFLFLIPGAYLEFPADPWEHYDRIFSWLGKGLVWEHGTRQRFAYYWAWTWLGAVPLPWRRLALDLYSAVWQWALAGYFYLLLRRLGFEKRLAWLQVFAAVVFFGTGVFSFRYYALSSTPLAYLLYLQSLILLLDAMAGKTRSALFLPLVFVGIYFNHTQEMVFVFLSGLGVVGYFLLRAHPMARRWVAVAAVLSGVAAVAISKGYGLGLPPVLHAHSRHFTTYGLPGCIGVAFCFYFFRQNPLFCVLSLLPLVALLWPPFALLTGILIHEPSDSYRLLYAFPTAFAFALAVERFCRHLPGRWGAHSAATAGGMVFLLSLLFPYPWLGRGVFQLYRTPTFLDLKWLEQTQTWFDSYGGPRPKCLLAADHVATFGLRSSLFEFVFEPGRDPRLNPISRLHELATEKQFRTFVEGQGICGLLVMAPERRASLKVPRSRIGKWSGHWNEHHVEIALQLPDRLYGFIAGLKEKGWTSQPVPPFYVLWLSPAARL